MYEFQQPKWEKKSFSLLPPALRPWIEEAGSFMRRIKSYGIFPEVQLLQQSWQHPMPNERLLLNIPLREYALIREVLIISENKKWMFARTVFTRAILSGKQLQLARLKNRSLGTVLFNDPHLQRSKFEIACLTAKTDWYRHISQYIPIHVESLWARRSLFITQHKPILLTEIFLPDMQTI